MLRDFVEKLKSSTSNGPRDAESASEERSPSPAPAPLIEHQPPASPAPQSTSRQSVLGTDVEIKGSIHFTHDLLVDGRVEGDICSDGILTVGEHAVIKGEIKTRSVVILGNVEGTITTQDRCELRNTATLVGDIAAGTLTIEAGASFIGQSRIGKRQGGIKKTPDHADKPLQILQGTLSAETPAQPSVVMPARQAA
jgi:cytoskeletal protein CcmA (bactofilin family)